MKKLNKIALNLFAIVAIFLATSILVSTVSYAQTQTTQKDNLICRLFPFIGQIEFTQGLCGRESSAEEAILEVAGLIRFGLSLIFIGIITVAVFYIIKASINYIRSEGDEGKVQESTKAIKAVFVGIAVLILSLLGLVIFLAFFGGTEALNQEAPQENTTLRQFWDAILGT